MNDRYDPFCPISGDEVSIIGSALQSYLHTEARRHVDHCAMLDEAAAEQYADDPAALQNLEREKARSRAELRRIDELRRRYIVDPMFTVDQLLKHTQPHTTTHGG